MTKAESGELIWDALATGAKLTKKQIILLTDLTEGQWHNGLRHLKDVFQGERVQPIAYKPRTRQYFLATQYRESRNYANWGLRGLTSRARRITSNIAAAADKFPEWPTARRVSRHAKTLVEDLKDMAAEIEDHS